MNGFYYNGLPREEKAAYEQMKAGFETLAATVRVVRLEQKRLAEVYLRLKLDEPLLFYVTGYRYRFYPASDHVELLRSTSLKKARSAPISRPFPPASSGSSGRCRGKVRRKRSCISTTSFWITSAMTS